MKLLTILLLSSITFLPVKSQTTSVTSTNNKISIDVLKSQKDQSNSWFLKVNYNSNGKSQTVIPKIKLGLSRNDKNFSDELTLVKTSKPRQINEKYTAITGKKSLCSNSASEITVFFENPDKSKLNVIIRAYNDGIVFRYESPG